MTKIKTNITSEDSSKRYLRILSRVDKELSGDWQGLNQKEALLLVNARLTLTHLSLSLNRKLIPKS